MDGSSVFCTGISIFFGLCAGFAQPGDERILLGAAALAFLTVALWLPSQHRHAPETENVQETKITTATNRSPPGPQ